MDFRTGRKTHNTRVEEKNFFYMLWNYKTYRLFFVLVKYLQLWSTVQCLRIKFTAFQDSYDKKEKKKTKKTRKKAPPPQKIKKKKKNHRSAINTCSVFLVAACKRITGFEQIHQIKET